MVNFLLSEMTFLRYYIPIAIELGSRGVRSTFVCKSSGKITAPSNLENRQRLEELSKEYEFDICDDIESNRPGPWILIEGSGIEKIKTNEKIYSISYMSDFNILYDKYVNRVDGIILPSIKFARYYKKESSKNLYLGSPKYDVPLDRESILSKYELSPDSKYAFFFYPKRRDRGNLDSMELISSLKDIGLTPLVKTRKKDGVDKNLGCRVFSDEPYWFPHPSLELISISNIVINTGSTGVKESVMLSKPILNLDIKPSPSMSFLYDYKFAIVQKKWNADLFKNNIVNLMNSNFELDFKKCKEENLFDDGSSRRIVNEILGNS